MLLLGSAVSDGHIETNAILTLRTSEAAVQCIVICPVCGFVCVFVGVFVCVSVTTITRNCMHRCSPDWVCKIKVVIISS